MRTSIKFAATYFGISLLLLIVIHILFPIVYSGETFLIVWFYLANLLIGILLFPLFWRIINKFKFESKIVYIILSFILIRLIINISSFICFQHSYIFILYTWHKGESKIDSTTICEICNSFVSFVIAYFIFRKSDMWECKKALHRN
jgi:ABC-type enterochelin transport system permease subunit